MSVRSSHRRKQCGGARTRGLVAGDRRGDVVERNARASTIVTSNRDTVEWIATFDDALLAQSAVDRFKNNAFDLVVDGESYRSRLKPSIDKLPPPPAAPVKKVPIHPRTKAAARRR